MKTEKTYQRWLFFMSLGKRLGCHQMCERSFHIKGYQFPLCARCSGLFFGQFIVAPIIIIFTSFNIWWLNLSLITLMAIDGIGQYYQFFVSNNIRRFVTGTLAGYGFTSIVIWLITQLIKSA